MKTINLQDHATQWEILHLYLWASSYAKKHSTREEYLAYLAA